jgi:hypothetical protein
MVVHVVGRTVLMLTNRPDQSFPDLSAMQSSRVLNELFAMYLIRDTHAYPNDVSATCLNIMQQLAGWLAGCQTSYI